MHIASFGGFAPVNNPAITVLVVFDTPATFPRDEGGDVAAPVFARVAQQVLAYLNVPHDVELQDSHRLQLLAKASKEDVNEAAPDHIGDGVETPNDAQIANAQPVPQPVITPTKAESGTPSATNVTPSLIPASAPATANRTVVLDVVGGIEVPDFRGKPLRTALEQAESAGLELEVSGSGVGIEQSPPAGSRIPPGGHVVVRFGR
jgi:cell division protein FtsI (penicillin-binding protein 3)